MTELRRQELMASLSMAIDLGLGQPMEHMLRACPIAARLAEAAGLDAERRSVVCHANLLAWIGCHADSEPLAGIMGDEIQFRARIYQAEGRVADDLLLHHRAQRAHGVVGAAHGVTAAGRDLQHLDRHRALLELPLQDRTS